MLLFFFSVMRVHRVVKRYDEFANWEPLFIGTTMDPWYDHRVTWEGGWDKKVQVGKKEINKTKYQPKYIGLFTAIHPMSQWIPVPSSQQRFHCQGAQDERYARLVST